MGVWEITDFYMNPGFTPAPAPAPDLVSIKLTTRYSGKICVKDAFNKSELVKEDSIRHCLYTLITRYSRQICVKDAFNRSELVKEDSIKHC